ncbi:MAG: 1,4-alpha-glucan branching enzyme, partial [Pseudomonadota bacterium]|nr:1,4-alpha-glucan branching enzyme [Pseudomonadota bacterium]
MPSEQAIYLFREGTNARSYDDLGCHLTDGAAHFAVWAPNASAVAVIGTWNGWDAAAQPLARRSDGSGIWEGSAGGVGRGDLYKFRILAAGG